MKDTSVQHSEELLLVIDKTGFNRPKSGIRQIQEYMQFFTLEMISIFFNYFNAIQYPFTSKLW